MKKAKKTAKIDNLMSFLEEITKKYPDLPLETQLKLQELSILMEISRKLK